MKPNTQKLKLFLLGTISVLAMNLSTHAATRTWNTGTGDWHTAANWSAAYVPVAADTVHFSNGGTAFITGDAQSKNSHLGYGAGNAGAVVITGTWTANELHVGSGTNSSGYLLVTDSGVMINEAKSYLGDSVGSSGTVRVSDSGTWSIGTNEIRIGDAGHGELIIEGAGVVENGRAYLAYAVGSTANVTVTGSGKWLTDGELRIGHNGTALFTISEHGYVESDAVTLANNADSSATVFMQGGGWDIYGALTVGSSGTASLTVSDGGEVRVDYDYVTMLGERAGSYGELNISGTAASVRTGDFIIGNTGVGHLAVTGNGGIVSEGNVAIGKNKNSVGTVEFDAIAISAWGTGIWDIDDGNLEIGVAGSGTVNLKNGRIVTEWRITLGVNETGIGVVNVSGSANFDGGGEHNHLTVGDAGVGILNISEQGSLDAWGGCVVLGSAKSGTGTIILSDNAKFHIVGDEEYEGYIIIGDKGVGSFIVNDQALLEADDVTLGQSSGGTGLLSVGGSAYATLTSLSVNTGTLAMAQSGSIRIHGNEGLSTTGALTFSGAGATLDYALNSADARITADSAIIGSGATLNLSLDSLFITKASQLADSFALIDTASGVTGNFTNQNYTLDVDYLAAPAEWLVNQDGVLAAQFILAWNDDPATAHGNFTLEAGRSFEVDVPLADREGPFGTGWDGKSLTKDGAGLLTLSGTQTYTGTTTVNDGILAIGGVFTGGGDLVNNSILLISATDSTFGAITSATNAATGVILTNSAINGDITGSDTSTTVIELNHSTLTGDTAATDQASITIIGDHNSTVSGDLTGSDNATVALTISGAGSTYQGDLTQTDNATVSANLGDGATGTGGVNGGNLLVGENSAWTFDKDSHGTNGENRGDWHIGDYHVTFDNLDNTGAINLNVNSDTGAGGSVTVTDTASGNGKVHLDTTGNGQLNPNAVLPGRVTGDGTEHWTWDPVNWGLEELLVTPHADGTLTITQNGTSPAGAVLNSAIAVQQSMWFAQQNSLLKRLGELRFNHPGTVSGQDDKTVTLSADSLIENIWLRSYGQQLNVGSQVAGRAYEQLIYGVDLGTDHKFTLSADSDLYLGVYAGYGRSDLDYRSPGTDGEINSYYGGLYATWLHSSGLYIDATFKAASVNNDLKAPYNGAQLKASYNDVNVGGSIEIGNKFTFQDGWFVEPQFQVNYLHILAEDYQAGPMSISAQNLDALQFRLGSLFGRTIRLANGGALQPYLKISGVETISSGGTLRNGYQSIRSNTDGARAELGGGVIWQLNTDNQLHLDYEASFGDKYDKPWGLTAGYRHQF
ncbi:MAG: autotransporter outer membrane beta-barrel domain-containing protein [Verrucomicrobiales bacterium]|jgi:outer membrane autotransporter protein|nr:autotransporter outer membrane beta-barrel domain-containing protein [Verrucomicrobiales bacterium]